MRARRMGLWIQYRIGKPLERRQFRGVGWPRTRRELLLRAVALPEAGRCDWLGSGDGVTFRAIRLALDFATFGGLGGFLFLVFSGFRSGSGAGGGLVGAGHREGNGAGGQDLALDLDFELSSRGKRRIQRKRSEFGVASVFEALAKGVGCPCAGFLVRYSVWGLDTVDVGSPGFFLFVSEMRFHRVFIKSWG